MNSYKKIMHVWLTFVSVCGFLVGWVFLGRSSELSYLADANTSTNDGSVTVTFEPIPQIVEPQSNSTTTSLNISTQSQAAQASVITPRRALRTRAS